MQGVEKLAGFIAAVGIAVTILYYFIVYVGPWLLLGALILGIVLVILYFTFKPKEVQMHERPVDGPMQVNIREQETNHKGFKCTLLLDVKISQKDWQAIERAGFMDHILFEYPDRSGKGGEDWTFQVSSLKGKGTFHFNFHNRAQLEAVKATLINNLRILRSHIDAQREAQISGPQQESIQI
jgi:hypothetical protein